MSSYSYTSPYGTPSTPPLSFPSMPSYNPSMYGLPPMSSLPGYGGPYMPPPAGAGGPPRVNTKAVPQRPPVRMSPSAFRQWAVANNKPHATYQSYTNYLSAHAPQAGNTPGGAPGSPVFGTGAMTINVNPNSKTDPTGMNALLRLYSSQMLTPQQQWAQAQSMVNNQISQGMAGMQSQLAYQNWLAGQNAQKAAGYAQALAQATAPNSQQILDAYKGAAGAMGAFGTGLTGAVQQAQQDAASHAASQLAGFGLTPSGGATGQTAGMVGSYDPNDIRNAAQYAGVTIPATTLEGEGANAMAQAQYARAASVGNVGQIANQYLMQNAQEQAQMMSQMMGLQAQRPSLMSTAYMNARQAGREDMAALSQALSMSAMYGMYNAHSGLYGAKTGQTTAQTTGLLPSGQLAPNFYWSTNNPKTRRPLPLPSGTIIKPGDTTYSHLVPAPKAAAGGGKMTPAQTATQTRLAAQATQKEIASEIAAATKAARTAAYSSVNPIFPTQTPTPTIKGANAYNIARQRLINAYVKPKYRNNPQVLSQIDDILAGIGYVKPAGTPKRR
jgi:hypothetical protein